MHRVHSVSLFWLSFFYATHLSAQTDDILTSLSSDMDNFKNIATITYQNEAYQPYVISVFQGKELEKLGVSNLKEALELVPGVDIATDNFNTKTPVFRGSNSLASGQSKLFVDGTLVNNVFFDAYAEYLSFPIEMIKRIEVVRGPGSKTDGVNAYAGSINIITYAEDIDGFKVKDKIVVKAGSYNYRMGGFIKSYKTDDFKLYMDFFYQEDNKKLYAGMDGYSQGSMSAFGYDNSGLGVSGDAPLWLKDYSLGLTLRYKDFSIKTRILDHTEGNAYGINLALPEDNGRLKRPNYYLELGYNKKINNFDVDVKAGIKYDAFDSKDKLGHDGIKFVDMIQFDTDGTINPVVFTDGIYGEHYAKQRILYQSSYLKYDGIDKHLITTGYRIVREETLDMVSKLSNWETGDVILADYTVIYPFFDKNAKRDTLILSLQDEYQFNDKFSFIYGVNYEQTSYKNAGAEPRVSMVYQLDTNNIFKTMYSKSHRNPSWQEMFTKNNHARVGNENLESEKVDAFEVAYIKKFSSTSYLQTNFFYLLNKNQIYNSSTNPQFKNDVDTDISGLEIEYKGHITSSDKIYMNYSYVTGTTKIKDDGISESLSNVAHHLAKAYYIYNISDKLSLSGVAKYVGSKGRENGDTREKVEAYATFDTSLSYKNRRNNYTLMFSVKNIFNENVKYPSPEKTYIEDYGQEERNFLISVAKEF